MGRSAPTLCAGCPALEAELVSAAAEHLVAGALLLLDPYVALGAPLRATQFSRLLGLQRLPIRSQAVMLSDCMWFSRWVVLYHLLRCRHYNGAIPGGMCDLTTKHIRVT